MRTIAVISQKGGVGKSTVAVHLAVAGTLAGLRTALVDLDPQATARKWGDKRQAPEPEVVGDHAERLPQLVEAARENGADLLVIDTAPNADRASLAAARAADLILIPCRPAAFDLEAIEATRDLATIAKRPAWVVLSSAPPRSAIVEEARRGLEEQGAKVAPQVIHQRVAYSYAVIDGRSASEYEPEGKAAEEVAALFQWVCGQVGLQAGGQDDKKTRGAIVTKRPSLFGTKAAPVAPAAAEAETDAPKVAEPASANAPPAEPASPTRYPKASTREGKRVVTAYISPEAFRQLKRISADEDAQVQDLLIEGLNAVFEKRSLSRIA